MGNMKRNNSYGFTIIEVSLFLAITGLMVAGLLVGTSASINRQRYSDAVSSLQTEMQALYSDASSVANERPLGNCANSGGVTVVTEEEQNATSRGQSNCIVMGRVITIDGVKRELSTYDIVGILPPSGADTPDDLASIRDALPAIYKKSRATTVLQWDTSVFVTTGGNTYYRGAYVYVVKSPASGSTYTFTQPVSASSLSWQDDSSSATTQPIDLSVFSADNRREAIVGVDPCGLVSGNSSMKVRVAPRASGSSAITLVPHTEALPQLNESGC